MSVSRVSRGQNSSYLDVYARDAAGENVLTRSLPLCTSIEEASNSMSIRFERWKRRGRGVDDWTSLFPSRSSKSGDGLRFGDGGSTPSSNAHAQVRNTHQPPHTIYTDIHSFIQSSTLVQGLSEGSGRARRYIQLGRRLRHKWHIRGVGVFPGSSFLRPSLHLGVYWGSLPQRERPSPLP